MKFLIDAQLPARLAGWLGRSGHDARHTLELPDGNRSSDAALIEYAARDGRIVVTKDSDFVQNFLVTGEPRLLLISTGNIANDALETLIVANLNPVERAFEAHRYVELSRTALVVHD